MIALDLTRCHFERRVQDIDVFGTWYFGGLSGPQPCLALLPANRPSGIEPTPVVVLQRDAWVWSPEFGEPAISVRRSMRYAHVLGLNTADMAQPLRIAAMLADLLPDLISIPPMPTSERVIVADVTRTDADGRTTEGVIFDYH